MSAGTVAFVGDAASGLDFAEQLAETLSSVTVLQVGPGEAADIASRDRLSCLVAPETVAGGLAAALTARASTPVVVPGDTDRSVFPEETPVLTVEGFERSSVVETVTELLGVTPDGGVTTAPTASDDHESATALLDAALSESVSGAFELDITTETVRIDGTAAALLGVEGPDDVETFEGLLGRIHPEDRTAFEAAVGQAIEGDGEFQCEFRLAARDRWLDARGQLGFEGDRPDALVGVLQDATERKAYQQTLARLHEASRDLLGAADGEAVAAVVRDAATELLELSGVGVFLFDEEQGGLAPTALSPEFADALGDVPAAWPTDGVVWEVYDAGEMQVLEHGAGYDVAPPGLAGGGLVVPIGSHGVLVAGVLEWTHVDTRTVELAQTLAANAAAALARTERERQLEVARQRTEAVLARVDGLVGDVMGDLTSAESVTSIYERICDRLTGTDPYVYAWVGAADFVEGPLAGVLLSGMGSDGAAGIEAIAAAGGATLVQSPETSAAPGMPSRALNTGAVDAARPAGELVATLLESLPANTDAP